MLSAMSNRAIPALILVWAVATTACNDTSSSTAVADLTGNWCGAQVADPTACVGDEVGYLDLTQNGDTVTGRACEAFEKDCYELQSGVVSGDKFTFFYTFDTFRVDGDFTLGVDALAGSYYSDKCTCQIALSFHRIK
jgi:hypothetical protein